MIQFTPLPKLKTGDKVAILSPSAGLPGLFPHVQDLGLERIKNELGLIPIEYPTTRQMGSSFTDRAQDLHAAFSDPEIKGVITSIGGSDQIGLIPYLDPAIFQANPKPVLGFSDNTHLQLFLWNLGIPFYYGGAVMTQFAMQQQMDQMTLDSIHFALFESGRKEITASDNYTDTNLNWADPNTLTQARSYEENEGFFWDGQSNSEGVLWGGCVESLIVQCTTNIHLPSSESLKGSILFLETSENMPDPWIVRYLLTGFGERGWLENFAGIIVGRPKAWSFEKPLTMEQKKEYKKEQRNVILDTVRKYNSTIPIVQNLDFGHTDPQILVPSGGQALIDGLNQKLYFEY